MVLTYSDNKHIIVCSLIKLIIPVYMIIGYLMSCLTEKITEFELPTFGRHITSLAFTPSTKSTNSKTESSHADLIRHIYVSTKSGVSLIWISGLL